MRLTVGPSNRIKIIERLQSHTKEYFKETISLDKGKILLHKGARVSLQQRSSMPRKSPLVVQYQPYEADATKDIKENREYSAKST